MGDMTYEPWIFRTLVFIEQEWQAVPRASAQAPIRATPRIERAVSTRASHASLAPRVPLG